MAVIKGDPAPWQKEQRIRDNLDGNPFSFLTLEDMWRSMLEGITRTPEGSEIGRLVQLLKAAGLTTVPPAKPPAGPETAPDENGEEIIE